MDWFPACAKKWMKNIPTAGKTDYTQCNLPECPMVARLVAVGNPPWPERRVQEFYSFVTREFWAQNFWVPNAVDILKHNPKRHRHTNF